MAAFSYQNPHPFLNLESVFFPNPTTNYKMSESFSQEPNTFTTANSFPHQVAISMDNSTTEITHSYIINDHQYPSSVSNKQSPDSSSVVLDQKLESGDEQITDHKLIMISSVDNKKKFKNGSSFNSAQYKDTREMNKWKKQKKSINCGDQGKKGRAEKKEEKKKVSEEVAPIGYIHVRARRGQATDSHSLAERVRREKISERMKLLQALVPGCDKVTGKALMLDEIINYVQSLQNQVEFLSFKLASVNPMFYDFGVDLDSFMVKPENMSSLALPMPNVQQCSPTGATNTFTTPNNYPLIIDSSTSLLFQQGQIPNILSQNNGQLLWDVDDQRHKLINQSTLSDNLCSFH